MRSAWVLRAAAVAVGAVMTVALPACGQSAGAPQGGASRAQRSGRTRPTGAPIGKTLRVKAGDTRLAVTVRRLIDPLRRSGALVDPGSRAIGVLLKVQNRGPGVYDSSSKSDLALFSTSGDEAASAFAPKGRCSTPEVDFLRQLGSGSTGEGCVVFSLEKGERVGRIRFAPEGRSRRAVVWAGSR